MFSPARLTRQTAAAWLVAALALASSPARADKAAETFVAGVLAEANEVFRTDDEAAVDAGVERLVDKYVDMNRVAMFVLGQYARVISEAQKAEYFPLFRRYATIVYQGALSNYSGERLAVTGSVDRTARDIIVDSKVVDAKPGQELHNLVVHWRVYRAGDGTMALVDSGANGVWLAIEQQSQFKSVIANSGGGAAGIDALIRELRAKVEAHRPLGGAQ
jgi:ABC-type transporter MlaC component